MALWAVIPPLLLLVYYYYRIPTAPSLLRLLLFFMFGAISGLLALSLEWVFETAVNIKSVGIGAIPSSSFSLLLESLRFFIIQMLPDLI